MAHTITDQQAIEQRITNLKERIRLYQEWLNADEAWLQLLELVKDTTPPPGTPHMAFPRPQCPDPHTTPTEPQAPKGSRGDSPESKVEQETQNKKRKFLLLRSRDGNATRH